MQEDWITYGKDNFRWIILDTSQDRITEIEQFHIDNHKHQLLELYNKRLDDVESNKNVQFSNETLARMSASHYGKVLSTETRTRISQSNKGKIHSLETRNKLKEAHQGSNSNTAKLDESIVYEIKKLIYNNELTLIEIAKLFDVEDVTIWDIKAGKTWTHVQFEFDTTTIKSNSYKGIKNPAAKLTDEDIPLIRKRIDSGESLTSIANRFSVSRTLIGYIKKGKLWSHIS